ncbi:MAG: hypothetical protein V5A51_05425, partial [Bacteroidales bacterium]
FPASFLLILMNPFGSPMAVSFFNVLYSFVGLSCETIVKQILSKASNHKFQITNTCPDGRRGISNLNYQNSKLSEIPNYKLYLGV